MDNEPQAIFETTIDGKTARASIMPREYDPRPLPDGDLEDVARKAFAEMSPWFDPKQSITRIK